MFSLSDPCKHWLGLPDGDLTVVLVEQCLKPIRDDLWVTAACVDRLVSDVAVQRMLLEIGIERTQNAAEYAKEVFAPSSPNKDDDDDGLNGARDSRQRDARRSHDSLVAHFREVPVHVQLCHMRAILLHRLDRLNTYAEICKGAPGQDYDGLEEWNDDPWADGTAESSTISASPFPPVTLPVFLTDGLIRVTRLLASHQWFAALHVLFDRHGSYLWPYRFAVLDSIPEYAHPSQYRDILPGFDNTTDAEQTVVSNPWRPESDWSERSEVRIAVEVSGFSLGIELPSDSLNIQGTSQLEPLAAIPLCTWYKDRVNRIISSTGMVDIALATVQHGASQGVPDLDELGEELSLFYRLIYDAPQREDEDMDEDWTLAQWNAMDPLSVVRAYLAHSTPETLIGDINRLVMPYLFVLEARAERAGNPDPGILNRLLFEYILTAPLEMAAATFEASKPTLPDAERLIRDDEDIARLALACLYGSDSLHEWSTMSRIFECLPAWNVVGDEKGDEDAADTTIISIGAFVTPSTTHPRCTASDLLLFFNPLPVTSLSRALDILDVHLESGEILARWGVPAPLRWFLQSADDIGEQRAWVNRMARRAGGSEDKLETESDWAWLLDDMLKLCSTGENGLKGAFGLLDKKEVIRIFFSGLMSTGKFDIAQVLLHASKSKLSLDSNDVEDICLSCSREFYDNASSGNYTFGDMKLAYQCLDIPLPSDRVLREKEFIEATSRLSSFNVMSHPGIPISPIEIRLTKDRLSLVSSVLSSNDDAYKHTEVILELVRKLGFRDNVTAEVKTLAMLVETALQAENFIRAYETSERMVDTIFRLRSSGMHGPEIQEASEVCWVACFQLGRQSEFDEVEKKQTLFGRALEFCPPDKIHDVLTAWRRLEKEDIENRQERLLHRRSGTDATTAPRLQRFALANTLAARLQEFRMPSPPLLTTPDAAALASRTFKSVAASFPFSVGGRGRSLGSHDENKSGGEGRRRLDGEDVSTQATRVLSKGIGWLIGDDS